MFESGEQILIERSSRQASLKALGIIGDESLTLLACVTELLKAVGKLDPVAIKLETQGDARILWVELGECGLRCRIVGERHPSILSERWPERDADQEIEQSIARETRGGIGIESVIDAAPREFVCGRRDRIKPEVRVKRLLITDTL